MTYSNFFYYVPYLVPILAEVLARGYDNLPGVGVCPLDRQAALLVHAHSTPQNGHLLLLFRTVVQVIRSAIGLIIKSSGPNNPMLP